MSETTSENYRAAVTAHNAAYIKFQAARKVYREGGTDADYLAAHAEYKKATDAFDVAYAAEVK